MKEGTLSKDRKASTHLKDSVIPLGLYTAPCDCSSQVMPALSSQTSFSFPETEIQNGLETAA